MFPPRPKQNNVQVVDNKGIEYKDDEPKDSDSNEQGSISVHRGNPVLNLQTKDTLNTLPNSSSNYCQLHKQYKQSQSDSPLTCFCNT